jgi:hypothetical protein
MGWGCQDCAEQFTLKEGYPYYVYMVKDSVWKKAGLTYYENVCIPCLAKRLGRKLTPKDFTKKPSCNWIIHQTKPFKYYKFSPTLKILTWGKGGVEGFLKWWDMAKRESDMRTARNMILEGKA